MTQPKDAERLRVLVIEDDSVDMLALQRLVDRDDLAWDLTPAYSLTEARACLARGDYDVVLIDEVLPDGSGSDLLESLGEMPALVVAGDRGAAFREEVLRRGARAFLEKGPKRTYLTRLAAVIEAILEERTGRRE